jgi:hypothetical protein
MGHATASPCLDPQAPIADSSATDSPALAARSLSTERLETELITHEAWETSAVARMLPLLREFNERRVWEAWGSPSPQHWLSWKCGLGYTAATERLRVARRLAELPHTEQAFLDGHLSWSKVREITRVATPRTDERWAETARWATAAQLSRLVGTARRVTRDDALQQRLDRQLTWRTEADGAVTLHVRLPAEEAQRVIDTVRQHTQPVDGQPMAASMADTLLELVTRPADDAPPPVELHLHVEHHPVTGAPAALTDDGHPIAAVTLDALACDATITTHGTADDGTPVELDRRRAATAAQRRAIAARHRTCQFDECHHTGRFHVHHLVHHAQGGRTVLSNMARLCPFHHRLVHLWGLLLSFGPDRRLIVNRHDGTPLDPTLLRARHDHDLPDSGDVPDPARLGQWMGDPMRLDDALLALLN